ncbi:MAG TPA: ABC transporter permease [Candidatus Limnocylindria bacterium]|nr:ABC transporter permease [Candidatus Limnocylindria bacterium]
MGERASWKTLPIRVARNRAAVAGFAVVLLFLLVAVLAPWLAPYDPGAQALDSGLSGPSRSHWLGQDRLGRDLLSRLVYGARISVAVGLGTVSLSLLIGLLVGSASGFLGGKVDHVLMRLADVLLAFPGILLAIAITSVLGPSLRNVLIALCALGWVGYARLIRGQILKVREMEFVQSARSVGAPPARLLLVHILPNAISPVIVEATFGIARAIVAEAGLSFLGLGVNPPTPSWGAMISEGRHFLFVAPHLTTVPGLAIMITVMAFNFLGDGLRDAMDVREEIR